MQAYHHQQIANLNLQNNSGPGLLVTTAQHQQQHQQQQQQQLLLNQQQSNQTYQELVKAYLPQTMATSHYNGIMTSFAIRLMSLNAHELRCLTSDMELMRIIDKAQSLIETRLQDINLNYNLRHQTQQQLQQHDDQQHLLQLTTSPETYYQNFYVQQQQQHQANQQLLLMASKYNEQTQTGSPLSNGLVGLNSMLINHQQQHIATNNDQTPTSSITSSLSSSSSSSLSSANDATTASHGNQRDHKQQPKQNGLDLRTTSRPTSAISDTPSPSRAGSTGSGGAQHPKKIKLTEYRRLQQLAEQATQQQHICDTAASSGPPSQSMSQANSSVASATSAVASVVAVKKYKGEFDEPTNEDVAERERSLSQAPPANYHIESALKTGTCACVLGSEFHDKTSTEALELLERWRSLNIDERVKWKWDVNDLPKDIPLSDIKKYEDLRRDYSRGRADFGGASKRKPLSIRGTRQFLLMLYCLHGHPGRDDIMQKEGYCPHCFAKIRTENEQSTLVRVVNHFNMKHRRGANPRLSPHLETGPGRVGAPAAGTSSSSSTTLASPTQIRDTLDSMVESAVASVDTGEQIVSVKAECCLQSSDLQHQQDEQSKIQEKVITNRRVTRDSVHNLRGEPK